MPMRQPSRAADLYAWHRAALAGLRPPRVEDEPQCGWYKRRFVKDGPWIPVRIYLVQEIDPETGELTAPEQFRAECLGQSVDPVGVWPFCRPISRADHDALVEHHLALDLMAATHAAVDLSQKPMRPRRSLA